MPVSLVKALLVLLPMCVLFSGSVVLCLRRKTVASFLHLLGAGCLVVVVLTHVAEALQWFPSMHWGDKQSIGHYLDLSSAGLGVTLFSVGYLCEALCARETHGGA
jgi:formate hydrogenlyase subunit 3/multisubunit Na+/H+ antiporter MnhD subunit